MVGPRLKVPAVFEEQLAKLKLEASEKERRSLESGSDAAAVNKKKKKLQKLDSMAKLWLPRSARLVLSGISLNSDLAQSIGLDSSTTRTYGKPQMLQALAAGWAPTFSSKPFDVDAAKSFLVEYSQNVSWNWSPACPPTRATIDNILIRAKNSAPGWDGLTYDCWAKAGPTAAGVLFRQTQELIQGAPMDVGFTMSMWCFPAKKPIPGEAPGEVLRSPQETRPIACNVVDKKVAAAAACNAVSAMIDLQTIWRQRGFVPNRQIAQNVLEMTAGCKP